MYCSYALYRPTRGDRRRNKSDAVKLEATGCCNASNGRSSANEFESHRPYVDMLQGMYVTPKVWLLHIAAER